MLLSVICIVLVMAAIIGAAVYFGFVDKDKGVEGNINDISDKLHNVGKEITGLH